MATEAQGYKPLIKNRIRTIWEGEKNEANKEHIFMAL